MGLGYHQFRMVGRYWSRGDPDLCNSFAVQTGLENRSKPSSRSNDHLCGDVRRSISDLAYGSRLDGILLSPLSKYAWCALAEFQFTVALGCICDINLFYCFCIILVLWSITRPGICKGQGPVEMEKVFLWSHVLWMVRFHQTLAAS